MLTFQSLGLFTSNDLRFFSLFFVLLAGLIFFLATVFKLYTILKINRFIEAVRHYLSLTILGKYLNKSYLHLC